MLIQNCFQLSWGQHDICSVRDKYAGKLGPSRRILDYKTEILHLVDTFLASSSQTKAEEINRGIDGDELKKCDADEASTDINNGDFKMELDYGEHFEVKFYVT